MVVSTTPEKLATKSATGTGTFEKMKFGSWDEDLEKEKEKARMGDAGQHSDSDSTSTARSGSLHSGHGMLPATASASEERPATQEYLAQLMNDRNQLRMMPSSFTHSSRLLDREIARVLSALSTQVSAAESISEEVLGEKVFLSETIMIPVDKYPRYNFVGRILGPRGMTAKQMEEETGCKIMVRGRGSCRMYQGVRRERSNDNEPLHVLVQCEDFKSRGMKKMKIAVDAINQLLCPPPDGKDELKRKQLIELSIINGTYRPTPATKNALQVARPGSAAHLPSSLDSPQYYDPARMIYALVEANKAPGPPHSNMNRNDTQSADDQLAQLTQLLSMYAPLQQNTVNSNFSPDYWRMMSDPNMLALLCGAGGNLPSSQDSFGMQPAGSIPQASYQQYLHAAALLNSVPYLHDGSGDAPKHSKR